MVVLLCKGSKNKIINPRPLKKGNFLDKGIENIIYYSLSLFCDQKSNQKTLDCKT